MSDEGIKDITIIGAGPSGLFTAFQAGMYEASVRLIDSMPEPGGQLTALYPEKYIFDVPGFTKITAKDLAGNLFEQANQFSPELRLNETAVDIIETMRPAPAILHSAGEVPGLPGETTKPMMPAPGALHPAKEVPFSPIFEVATDKGHYLSRAVIIAAGLGAFKPRTLDIPEMQKFEGNGVYYLIKEKDAFRGKDVVIVGGGDSALDWVMNLLDTAGNITLVHRREIFRAQPKTLQQVAENAERGRIRVLAPYEVTGVSGNQHLEEVVVVDGTGKETIIKTDALLLMLGFTSDIEQIGKWGLDLGDSRIKVNPNMETNRRGIFAVGDITNYPGKLKLILTGFSEGAQAVRNAVLFIRPGEKVKHSYSTSLKIFSKK